MLVTADAALLGGVRVHQVSITALCCARAAINPSGSQSSG